MRPRVGAARGVWCALGCMTAVFVLVNVYVAQLTLSTRRRHERPLIPGMLLQTPRNPVVVSKDGPLALQQQPLIQPKPDGKESVVERLQEATIPVNATLRARLPTWEQVQQVVGDHPILWTDRCAEFRQRVPAVRRMLGAAGMFSTGTNLVTTLLKQNCQIPERVAYYGVNATKEAHGMRWQVPWGKHTPAHYKESHATDKAKEIAKDDILPVVTIRNPYRWMASMCRNPYTARWSHRPDHCPQLQTANGDWNRVSVKYGAGKESYLSLAHLYNDWYHGYTQNASYPWIMIRMEDLIFYTKQTITQVCECAGGRIRTDRPFTYTIASAKADSQGHDTSVGFVEAWIRYSQPLSPRGEFSDVDYHAAVDALDPALLERFGYSHPAPN